MNSALVVIDVQNYFVNKNTQNLPKQIAGFIESNKNKFDFVIFTRFVNKRDSNFVKCLKWEKCFALAETQIYAELARFTNKDNVFQKTSYSVFKSKKLVRFLKKNNIGKLFLCGIDIDACVLASAFDGFDLGYDITVLQKLSLSHSGKKLNDAAVAILNKNL